MVKFHVSENGDVESVEAVRNNSSDSDSPVLEEAALRAARQWKFKPYLVNGKPMKFTTTVPFVFRINEQVSDWGSKDPSAPVRAVEDKVLQGWVVHRVQPAYPEKAKKALLGGAVVLDAIIDRQGSIRYLHVVKGHPILAQASVDAVKQWRYRPYVVDGEPVEVETKITVNFTMSH